MVVLVPIGPQRANWLGTSLIRAIASLKLRSGHRRCIPGGVVYFGYGNGGTDAEYIVAASATTGDVLWTYVAGTANTLGNAAPTVGNGMVHFTCASNSDNFKGICAVSQSSGSVEWSADTGSTTMGLSLGSNSVAWR